MTMNRAAVIDKVCVVRPSIMPGALLCLLIEGLEGWVHKVNSRVQVLCPCLSEAVTGGAEAGGRWQRFWELFMFLLMTHETE